MRAALPAFLVVAVLLFSPWMPVTPQEGDATSAASVHQDLTWWPEGQTQVGEGFHLRVPVTVTNPRDHPVQDGTVLVELDLTRKLIEAGWVKERRSGEEVLRSFRFDENSVRVVGMHDWNDPDRLQDLRNHDSDMGRTNPLRQVVPSTFYKGSLTQENVRYTPDANPVVTVVWRVEAQLGPGDARHYMIYFDSLTNSPDQTGHDPIDQSPIRGSGTLQGTYGPGAGMELVGHIDPTHPTGRHHVSVIGLHDDTQVRVEVSRTGGSFRFEQLLGVPENPFTIHQGTFNDVRIGSAHSYFRLIADKPVLALVDSEGYVPAPGGGIVGDEFFFTTNSRNTGQDSVIFLNLRDGALQDPSIEEAETQVDLETLNGDGEVVATRRILLSDSGGVNQFPYTLGARAYQGPDCSNSVGTGQSDVALVEPGQRYRARVVDGGPVAIQMLPTTGATQIPAIDGAPTGLEFWSALSRFRGPGPNCGEVRQYSVFAAATGDAHLETTSPEVNPEDHPLSRNALGRAPAQAITGITTETLHVNNRPVEFRTTEPAWLIVDPDQATTAQDIMLRGPLAGTEAGRSFVGLGPTTIYAPYPDTRVEARIDYAVEGLREETLNIPGGNLGGLPEHDGTFGAIGWYTLNANRPIVVLPQGAQPGFLAGVPVTLDAQVHQADYRGHLVEIQPISSLAALTRTGETAEYAFRVTNLGQAVHGGDLPDIIDLHHSPAPEDWEVRIHPETTPPLASGESMVVRLFVTPGEEVPTDESASVRIEATSRGNPNVRHNVLTSTHIESVYGVTLVFGEFDTVAEARQGGTRAQIMRGVPGETGELRYNITLANSGTEPDTIRLDHTPPDTGWDLLLIHRESQAEVPTIDLGPGETAPLQLIVRPPELGENEPATLHTTLTAQSLGEPATSAEIFATTRMTPPSDLSMEALTSIQWIKPGQEAVFDLMMRNEGGQSNVLFDVQHDASAEWGTPEVFLTAPETGDRFSLLGIETSVGANREMKFQASITAPENVTASEQIVIRLQAATPGFDETFEEFLVAIVLPVHQLNVTPPPLPIQVEQGGNPIPVELGLFNTGNLDERLRPTITTVPPGWALTFPDPELFIPRGLEQDTILRAEILPPTGVPDGEYLIVIDLVSQEGNRTQIELPVVVGTYLAHAIHGPDRIHGQPGRTAWLEYTFENQGNDAVSVSFEPAEDEPWELAGTATTRVLPPGAQAVLRVGWEIPREGVPDGESTHEAVLVMHPENPDVHTVRRTLEATIEVGRPNLQIVQATAHPGAAGQIIRVQIGNEGTRSAHDVTVELRVGGQSVDQTQIAEIAPGSTRNLTFLQPDGLEGSTTIVIDPENRIVEMDKMNNTYSVGEGFESETLPVVLAPILVLVIFGGIAIRRYKMPGRK